MKTRLLIAAGALLLSTAAAAETLWITNVNLVSPEQPGRVGPGSVLVRDGIIAAVERGPARAVPPGVRKVDGKGYYLTPGLIDSHVHLFGVPGMSFDHVKRHKGIVEAYYRQMPRSYLYYGYTTVIDLAVSDRAVIDNFNRAPLHPDVVHCGEPLVYANGYPMSWIAPVERFEMFGNFIYDPAQAAAIPKRFTPADHTPEAGVARVAKGGGKCVKTHYERGFGANRKLPVMSDRVFADVKSAAVKNGLVLVTHGNSFEAQSFAVRGNADVLAHGMWHWGPHNASKELPAEIRALLDQIVARRIGYQPTMQVLYGMLAYLNPAYLNDPAVRKVVPAALADWFATPEGKWFKEEVAEGESDADALLGFEAPLRRQKMVLAYLASKDANFTFGSDTPSSPTYGNLPGLNGYLEMRRLHQAGLSLEQVFRAATINNARTFRLDAEVGTIEKGKKANLLLMKMSPLQDLAAYDNIVTVWIGGKEVERASLAAGN
ncbi:amidohydrolase family protein [Massilia sp. GCM10020059]|uniref:Amidohydrolase family protein n=1 Tax=Massilia agrisoli TaxID=2892444 RepID=A0ABS8IZR0_9BURK|nr:amidohydrolase family protein [Massilia agrisoli]MCC6073302.1 amidohydrolase family protein [Massilia agrisoli]